MKIEKSSVTTGRDGLSYKVEIFVESHSDQEKYPEGVKAVFKLIRLDVNEENETELMVLIDNHKPLGFHSHDKLPENHDFREPLYINDWREAWEIFQSKCQEILK